ncbi:GpE family phage tail protein [Erwinia sp. LJJL01]|uniref:GpE family phage tail protein n=1 Tax=Erwinia sp. LJJL01 TaxID=3391839 RepID=UPI0039AF01FE
MGVERDSSGRSLIRCPAVDTDELIADIAVIFHWQPSTYDTMPVEEFLTWHKRALARNGQEE